MAELQATGGREGESWRRLLPEGQPIVVGRESDPWSVPWEPFLSRRHVELTWAPPRLQLRTLPDAANPVYLRGEPTRTCSLRAGERFVIGDTVFTLCHSTSASPSTPDQRPVLHSYSLGADELRQVPFRDAPHRLDVLRHLVRVIESTADEPELFEQSVNLLLEGIRKADVICLVSLEPNAEPPRVHVLSSGHRTGVTGEFRPSGRLVRQALERERNSVVHVWSEQTRGGEGEAFTLQGDFDWAFCTPVRGGGEAPGLGIYVAGRLVGASPATALAPWDSNDLSEDVKFAELVSAIVGALRQTRSLQHRQSVLSHFFSPSVLRIVSAGDPETALKPREADVTVLFCDLRGFSRQVERESEHLFEILERVSSALGIMTKCILAHKGVVADFLGDAAMAFWGWPLSHDDDPQHACLAALDIRAAFEAIARQPDHPLADFRVGVGVATGPAVAGQIGSQEQAKVTVFGPVVNLASRLEGLTKILHVPILVDETTARAVRERMTLDVARCRRLARVRPYGLENPLDVSELLLPETPQSLLTGHHLSQYESALSAFLEGRWAEAYELLHDIPPQDLGKDLLLSFILQHNHSPPPHWDGVIPILSK